MKKVLIVLLTLALCLGTITALAADEKEKPQSDGMMVRAESLEDIKKALEETSMYYGGAQMKLFSGMARNAVMVEEAEVGTDFGAMAPGAAEESIQDMAGDSGTSDFSGTNVQVEGIDEADIIKTDGEYLYIVGNNKVFIVEAREGNMETLGEINIGKNYSVQSIFIDKDRLVLFGNYIPETAVKPGAREDVLYKEPQVDRGCCWIDTDSYTYAAIYDTSDKSRPELLQELNVEGSLRAVRKSGDYIYLAASKNVYTVMPLAEAEAQDLLPQYRDTAAEAGGEEADSALSAMVSGIDLFRSKGSIGTSTSERDMSVLEPGDIYICPITEESSFTTIAVLDIGGDRPAALSSYMGSMGEFYMNSQSAYMTFYKYDNETYDVLTQIIALDIDGMNVEYRAEGTVKGSLLNQFSMDEYNGYFRIATTRWDKGSSLYVMDEKLDITGSIENIAVGEQIYSVRFMGDRGYIVTFETMDPFFTVDLSDPENPVIAGELKLPGYSNYLHQIDENTVLGIGRQTQEIYVRNEKGNEEVIGFRQGGIKLTLFDIEDFSNPLELHSLVVGDENTWSDALYDHKGIMVDSGRGLFGMCISSWSEKGKAPASGAYIFDVTGGEIKRDGLMAYSEEGRKGEYGFYGSRICYIGDVFYYLQDGLIKSFSRENYEEISQLFL